MKIHGVLRNYIRGPGYVGLSRHSSSVPCPSTEGFWVRLAKLESPSQMEVKCVTRRMLVVGTIAIKAVKVSVLAAAPELAVAAGDEACSVKYIEEERVVWSPKYR